jgi:nucleoside-diphosphate-sugar epimerase
MFYFDQEDHLVARQQGRPWQWVALRPHTICGFSLFSAMNIMTAIGVYATLSKTLGLPLRFPGKPGAYNAVYQACEARHLAKGILWAMTADAAANQAFNITNGDFFRWENLWPVFADFFGMPAGPVHTLGLTDYMADKAPLWQEIVDRHGLQPYPYADLVAWPFADYVFGCDWDVMSSTTKIRQAGFQDVVDSESMFLRLFQEFRDARIIP